MREAEYVGVRTIGQDEGARAIGGVRACGSCCADGVAIHRCFERRIIGPRGAQCAGVAHGLVHVRVQHRYRPTAVIGAEIVEAIRLHIVEGGSGQGSC